MPPISSDSPRLEIAHVLFMDLVEFSRSPTEEQTRFLTELQDIVRATLEFTRSDASDGLIRLPTGDGMALVFLHDPVAPVQCAIQISEPLRRRPHIRLRMGVHSGPVYLVEDINGHRNASGGGVNMAERVMDCGDAGHILLSNAAAELLRQVGAWPLHDLGEVDVKHGVRLHLFNLCRRSNAPETRVHEQQCRTATKGGCSMKIDYWRGLFCTATAGLLAESKAERGKERAKGRILMATCLMSLTLPQLTGCKGKTIIVGGSGNVVQGSGVVKTETREVSDFSSISIGVVGDVTIEQTGRELVTIRGEDNILPLLRSRVAKGILLLEGAPGKGYSTTKSLEFRVEVKQLNRLTIGGSGNVVAKNLHGKRMSVSISGVGDATLSGSTEALDVDNSGSGSFRGEGFEAKQAKVRVGGVGSAVINVSEQLDATVAGSGSIEAGSLQGNKVSVSISGVGDVTVSGSAQVLDVDVSGSGNYRGEKCRTKRAKVRTRGVGGAVINVSEQLDATVAGSGSIEAKGLQGKRLSISMSNVGDVTVSGSAEVLDVDISGSGSYRGEDCKTKQAKVRTSGVGGAVINVSDQLDATVTGSGSVEYIGSPQVRQSVSGVGEVRKR